MRNVTSAVKRLDRVIAKVGDNEIKIPVFVRLLNKEFETLSVKFRSKQHEYYSISGYYSGKIKDEDDSRYNIFITYEKTDNTLYPIGIRSDLLAVIIHELRHGYQDNKRHNRLKYGGASFDRMVKASDAIQNDKQEEFNYLANMDEMDAYAYEVAYSKKQGERSSWIINRYKNVVAEQDPKLYNRFLTKVYKFTQEE
jgi:hypothetical protein